MGRIAPISGGNDGDRISLFGRESWGGVDPPSGRHIKESSDRHKGTIDSDRAAYEARRQLDERRRMPRDRLKQRAHNERPSLK